MIVSGALVWYNETPETLDRCIRGLANVADRVVALDGAYARYPGGKVVSPRAQAAAIKAAAADVGLECQIHTIDRLWAGQVEKRSRLMELAMDGSDWVAVVDADHVVEGSRDGTRRALERASVDSFEVPFFTPTNDARPIEDSAASLWHQSMAGRELLTRHLFRSLPGVRVERLHWWYSAIKDGNRGWLWGGDGSYPPLPTGRFPVDDYRITHLCLSRSEDEVLNNRAFINDRTMIMSRTGQEDAVDGLPPPNYDYVTQEPV